MPCLDDFAKWSKRRFYPCRIAGAAFGVTVEVLLTPILKKTTRQDRRLVPWNILDKAIPPVFEGDDAPCWKSSWSLAATRLATCDWREQDHPFHQSGVLACKTTNRHRAPGVRDKGDLVERVIIENKPHSSLQLLCGVLCNAKRRIVDWEVHPS